MCVCACVCVCVCVCVRVLGHLWGASSNEARGKEKTSNKQWKWQWKCSFTIRFWALDLRNTWVCGVLCMVTGMETVVGDYGELSIVLFISILIYVSFPLQCTKQSSSYLQCKPLKSAYKLQGSTIRMLSCQASTLHFYLPCKHFVWHHQKRIVDNSLSHKNGCTR